MGIYSISNHSPVENAVGKYVKESFLESCINETASNILDEISNIDTKSITELFESMSNLEIKIENSSLSNDIKHSLRCSLIEHVYSKINEHSIEEEALLTESEFESILEFDGNAKKNEEFIKILKDIDTLTQMNLEKIKKCITDLEKYQQWSDDIIKNPGKISSYITKIKKDNVDFNKWLNQKRTINGPQTFANLKRSAKSFNNKYSEIVMASKKEISAKFDKVDKEINKLITPWSSNGKAVCDLIDSTNQIITEIDRANGLIFQRQIRAIYDYMLDEAEWTLTDLHEFGKVLNIEFENNKMYKFINSFIKSKKK